MSRALWPALWLALACKEKTDPTDDLPPITGDADADTDADADADADSDADTDLPTECWVDGELGTCWDCELPAAPEGDSAKALNQCSEVQAAPFDNADRIPASTWTPGDALPPVP